MKRPHYSDVIAATLFALVAPQLLRGDDKPVRLVNLKEEVAKSMKKIEDGTLKLLTREEFEKRSKEAQDNKNYGGFKTVDEGVVQAHYWYELVIKKGMMYASVNGVIRPDDPINTEPIANILMISGDLSKYLRQAYREGSNEKKIAIAAYIYTMNELVYNTKNSDLDVESFISDKALLSKEKDAIRAGTPITLVDVKANLLSYFTARWKRWDEDLELILVKGSYDLPQQKRK